MDNLRYLQTKHQRLGTVDIAARCTEHSNSIQRGDGIMQTAAQRPMPKLDGTGLTIGIVVARYNWHITERHAPACARGTESRRSKTSTWCRHLVPSTCDDGQSHVDGSFLSCRICFGCVMKGETRHDVVVSDAAAQGIQRVALTWACPSPSGDVRRESVPGRRTYCPWQGVCPSRRGDRTNGSVAQKSKASEGDR